jgi:hypothetical protein
VQQVLWHELIIESFWNITGILAFAEYTYIRGASQESMDQTTVRAWLASFESTVRRNNQLTVSTKIKNLFRSKVETVVTKEKKERK